MKNPANLIKNINHLFKIISDFLWIAVFLLLHQNVSAQIKSVSCYANEKAYSPFPGIIAVIQSNADLTNENMKISNNIQYLNADNRMQKMDET